MRPSGTRMPVVFFGHGSPMNTLERNQYTEAWQRIGEAIPAPRAVLCVSAHWYTEGTAVTAMSHPKTIHDFYGFPQALFEVQYPAPGEPSLASRVCELLAPVEVGLDQSWGLDHGTWSVLKHVYPDADVPVLQLSIDGTQPPRYHYETGRRLAPLRDEGILIAGSGNVVHNLRMMKRGGGQGYDWALRFNERIRDALAARDHATLVDFEKLGEDARLSVPTPEHYLPLLYIAGLQESDESMSFPVDGYDLGSISMLTAAAGLPAGETPVRRPGAPRA
jgi:4,5-DOPA dioxygenase extradiol